MPIEIYGREFNDLSDLADHLEIGKPLLRKLTRGLERSQWARALDTYLRRQGRGANLAPPTSEEITTFLGGAKPTGLNIRLESAPFYRAHVRSELIKQGVLSEGPEETQNTAELIYLWYHKRPRERCDCGQFRTFRSIVQGYWPSCGRACPSGHGLGRDSIRKKVAQRQHEAIGLDLGDCSDEAMRSAINTLLDKAEEKQVILLISQHSTLGPWVQGASASLPEDAEWAERIHVVMHGGEPYCSRGKRRKFRRLSDGYLYCGHQAKCPCSAEASVESHRQTLYEKVPSGYITVNRWAVRHHLHVSTMLRYAKAGRIQALQSGRYWFVPADLAPPSGDDQIECGICGKAFHAISNTHLKSHGLTRKEYQARFPGSAVSHGTARIIGAAALANLQKLFVERGFGGSGVEDEFADYLRVKGLAEKADFIRQWQPYAEAPMSMDFYLPDEGVVVEIDGPHHWEGWPYQVRQGKTREDMFRQQQQRDRARDTWVRKLGLRMIRVRVRSSLNDIEPLYDQLKRQNFPEYLL